MEGVSGMKGRWREGGRLKERKRLHEWKEEM